MGDQHHGGSGFTLELIHQIENFGLDGDVERGGGFVRDQEGWIARHGTGDHHPLAHTAGQFMRILVEAAASFRDAHPVQPFAGLGRSVAGTQAKMQAQGLSNLFPDAHMGR